MDEYNNQNNVKNMCGLVNVDIEKLGETALEVYKDGISPTVKETGNLLALLPRGIRAALKPFEKWIIRQEFDCRELAASLERRLEGKEVVIPERYVVVPLLQSLSYSFDSSDLRELYAGLLATAMQAETKFTAHPAFVDIIRQLSPIEAKILKETNVLNVSTPICTIFIESASKIGSTEVLQSNFKSGSIFINNFALFDQTKDLPIDTSSALIANLLRLGLVEKPETMQISDEHAHDSFINSEAFIKIQNEFNDVYVRKEPDEQLYLLKSFLMPTEFGKLFFDICVY